MRCRENCTCWPMQHHLSITSHHAPRLVHRWSHGPCSSQTKPLWWTKTDDMQYMKTGKVPWMKDGQSLMDEDRRHELDSREPRGVDEDRRGAVDKHGPWGQRTRPWRLDADIHATFLSQLAIFVNNFHLFFSFRFWEIGLWVQLILDLFAAENLASRSE